MGDTMDYLFIINKVNPQILTGLLKLINASDKRAGKQDGLSLIVMGLQIIKINVFFFLIVTHI